MIAIYDQFIGLWSVWTRGDDRSAARHVGDFPSEGAARAFVAGSGVHHPDTTRVNP